jgi:hypothetical protein
MTLLLFGSGSKGVVIKEKNTSARLLQEERGTRPGSLLSLLTPLFVSSLYIGRRKDVISQYRIGSVGQDGRLLLWEFDDNFKQKQSSNARRDSMGYVVDKRG